jgi:hypothetical protein
VKVNAVSGIQCIYAGGKLSLVWDTVADRSGYNVKEDSKKAKFSLTNSYQVNLPQPNKIYSF